MSFNFTIYCLSCNIYLPQGWFVVSLDVLFLWPCYFTTILIVSLFLLFYPYYFMLLCCRCQNELVFSVAYSGATLITLMWTEPHGLKMKIRSFCSWLRILTWPGLILHKPSRLVTYIHNLYLDEVQLSPRVWSPLIRPLTSNTKITVFPDFSPSPVRDHMPVS